MNQRRAIRSVAVAGGGIVGLSAATAFARARPASSVTVIETAPDPSALADVLPTTHPGVARFHEFIGLDERDLVASGIATHHLGTRFENWSPSGRPWVHAFGNYGKPAGGIPFDQIWVQAHRTGKALPYDRYSMGATLARAGKFVHPAKDPAFIGSQFLYGLRFDPDLYRNRLRSHAESLNVQFVAGEILQIERGSAGINALRLSEAGSVQADLFVDCTGRRAQLLGEIDDSFEEWSAWMPFDRLSFSSQPSPDVPETSDRIGTSADGWKVEWPLRGRTMAAEVGNVGGVAITRGRRLRPWVGNVLALGDSATALDPLHGFNLALAQSAILLALELLPDPDYDPIETDEYNRRAEQVTRRVRDFIALHYVRGPWRDRPSVPLPDSLEHTLDQFEYRGRMPFYENESVTRDSWTAALLGLEVLPRNIDPHAASVPLDRAITAMERLAREIERIPETLPSYKDYLANLSV